ncbi:hypothetical protein HDV01_005504 [Terramyces sp. JEL0728]|nr:hypothetical protein HDV01_005504 [Terramyces sp. JEL0728]
MLVAYLTNPTTESIREAFKRNLHAELHERIKNLHLIQAQQLILKVNSVAIPAKAERTKVQKRKQRNTLYFQHKRVFQKPIETLYQQHVFDFTCFELFKINTSLADHIKQSKPLLTHLFQNTTNMSFYSSYINQLIITFVKEYNETKRFLLNGGKQRVNYKLLDYICSVYREIKSIGNVEIVLGSSLIELEILCLLAPFGNQSFVHGNEFMINEINSFY